MDLRRLARRREEARLTRMSDGLRAELGSPIPWMYRWTLAPDTTLEPPAELASVHETRLQTIAPVIRAALASAGPEASAVDLGCNEGWFAHRMLEWGAARVVGVDVRESNLKRAELLRDHFGIPRARLSFERAGIHDLDPSELGSFDVVLVLGLIYHLEDPIGGLRIARHLTKTGGLVVVESQLTAHEQPILHGWGETDVFREAAGHWASVFEPSAEQEADGNLLASYGGVLSLVPNRAALVQAMEVVGFRDVRMLEVPAGTNRQYVEGHRGIAAGRA